MIPWVAGASIVGYVVGWLVGRRFREDERISAHCAGIREGRRQVFEAERTTITSNMN